MHRSHPALTFLCLSFLLISGCATPISPSGGARDTEPIEVIQTSPEVGTTNFRGDQVSFSFNKFPDRNSIRQNITIEPNIGIQFDLDFGRKSVDVEFSERLPENTTIIVKLGSDVSDTRRNKISSPFDLAFSTGPVIDEGTVSGRLRNNERESVDAGERVFLFREPIDFTSPANYIAQTDTSGSFEFTYLREGTYSAIWVNDVNRDRKWNQERESAQPFHVETFEVFQGEETPIGTLYIQRPDTVAPRLDGVGLLSENRMRLRMSEEVFWTSGEAQFAINDSLQNLYTTAFPLYKTISDPLIVFAESEQALEESNMFEIIPTGFRDRSGNSLQVTAGPFSGSAVVDTTRLRIISNNSRGGLFPDQALEIVYSKSIDDPAVQDSLIVFEGDKAIENYQFVDVNRNRLRILPNGDWSAGIRYRFGVWDPDFMERQTVEPEIWQRNELGSIEFVPAEDDSTTLTRLSLTDDNRKIEIDTTFTGIIEIDQLPPLSYTARLYRDRNEDGEWNPGTVVPFSAPEPYFIRRAIPVRKGFASEVSVVFSGPPFAAGSRDLDQDDLPNENGGQQDQNEENNQ